MDRKLMVSFLFLLVVTVVTTLITVVADADVSITIVVLMVGTLGVFYWMQDDLTLFG
jgi:phage-related minor tail protein